MVKFMDINILVIGKEKILFLSIVEIIIYQMTMNTGVGSDFQSKNLNRYFFTITYELGANRFTSLKPDLINRGFAFSRCLNETFP